MQNKPSSTFVMVVSALCVAINIIAGTLIQMTKIPFLFLDTIGTIYVAAAFGPVAGMAVGLVTNLVLGVTAGPTNIPFALVSMVVGLIVGLMAKKGFGYVRAGITGLILAVACPLVGTPIAIWMFEGLTGGGMDFFVAWLLKSGQTIFAAAFLPRIASNLIDKIGSALLVAAMLRVIPARFGRRQGAQ